MRKRVKGEEHHLYNDAVVLQDTRHWFCQLCVFHDNGLAEVLDTFCFQTVPPILKVMSALEISWHRGICRALNLSALGNSAPDQMSDLLVVVCWHPDKAMRDALAAQYGSQAIFCAAGILHGTGFTEKVVSLLLHGHAPGN